MIWPDARLLCLLGNEKCDCQFDFVNICIFSSSKHEGHSFTNWNTEWRAAVAEQVFIRSKNTRWPFAGPEHCNQCSDNAGIVCDLSQFMLNMSYCVVVPSVLWHCWLGFRKSILRVKDRVMRWWHGYLSEVRCIYLHMVQLMPLLPHHLSSLASLRSRMVLPFWCRLTQNVLEKRPLNGCHVYCGIGTIYITLLRTLVSLQ